MDIGYKLQHIGQPRGPFISSLAEAMAKFKEKFEETANPANIREGHTWVWSRDRKKTEAFELIRDRMSRADAGYGFVMRAHKLTDPDKIAKNRQWAIWKTIQLDGPDVIQEAIELLGLRYVFGGSSEVNGLDCSGLTMDCIHDATGILLPHSANLQYHDDRFDLFQNVDKAKPGDSVFMHFGRLEPGEADHTGFFIDRRNGDPYMIDTRSTSSPVAIRPIEQDAVLAYGRIEEINGPL